MDKWRVPVGIIWIVLAVYQGLASLLHGAGNTTVSGVICLVAALMLVFDYWKGFVFVGVVGIVSVLWAIADIVTILTGDSSQINLRELFIAMRFIEIPVAVTAAVVAFKERP